MKIMKTASVPLVTHDPYFSVWSPSDHLYDADTVHWSRIPQRMYGSLKVDSETYFFMGNHDDNKVLAQTGMELTATSTIFYFENEDVKLSAQFTSPILLDDPLLVSRPCTYVDFVIEKKRDLEVSLNLEITADLVRYTKGKIIGGNHQASLPSGGSFHYSSMSKANQTPLGHSGDNITIDWGSLYLASDSEDTQIVFDSEEERLKGSTVICDQKEKVSFVIAYDDLLSIYYFGNWKKAYWTEKYATILDAIAASFEDREIVLMKARQFDQWLEETAKKSGGKDYAYLCNLSYRQSIAAHKLITDENGEIIFLSKENDSNGCIGTVDVSYPSVPLYLLHNTEYVKGMLRPVFRFSRLPVWEFDFAPHDVGRYPYASGQVYGLKDHKDEYDGENGNIPPFYYQFPKGCDVYEHHFQMPVEECGNMLIMTAAACLLDKNADFALPYMDSLKQWAKYLIDYGDDPGEQLCTDDFAGHLSHNVNLSAKAIVGIEAYAQILRLAGSEKDYETYHEKAKTMAKSWEDRAFDKDHYRLTFDGEGSWSLKYNTIWDKFFKSGLFSDQLYQMEIEYYLKKNQKYGVPLDNRKAYTKSDWILWSAAITDDPEKRKQLIEPVAEYQRETKSRIPFSDWYDTKSGKQCGFIARSVQGGIFMPILMDMT